MSENTAGTRPQFYDVRPPGVDPQRFAAGDRVMARFPGGDWPEVGLVVGKAYKVAKSSLFADEDFVSLEGVKRQDGNLAEFFAWRFERAPQFVPGDLVEVLDNVLSSRGAQIGRRLTVKRFGKSEYSDNPCDWVYLDEVDGGWFSEHFKLVEPTPVEVPNPQRELIEKARARAESARHRLAVLRAGTVANLEGNLSALMEDLICVEDILSQSLKEGR